MQKLTDPISAKLRDRLTEIAGTPPPLEMTVGEFAKILCGIKQEIFTLHGKVTKIRRSAKDSGITDAQKIVLQNLRLSLDAKQKLLNDMIGK